MPHDIIDNKTEKLAEHIKARLSEAERVKFAVGYFFAEGLRPIIEQLEDLKEIRLLIGSTSTKDTVEALALGYKKLEEAQRSFEDAAILTRTQKEVRFLTDEDSIIKAITKLPQTDENEALVQKIAALVEQGKLKVRIYLKEPLHAKVYIFDYPKGRVDPGVVITGSSNLTLAGLSSNTELNVVIYGKENHAKLTKWFENLWDQAEEFDERFMNALKGSWPLAEPTPFEVYIKVLYELFGDRLEVEEIKERKKLARPTLYSFQKDAVGQAIRILEKYNGVFISDVVGLGKTYVAAEILDQLKEHAVVVCPPSLRKMWEEVLYSFGVPIQTFSSGKLEELLEKEELLNTTKIIVVDESHHFRNPNTLSYQMLADICVGKKVILVTATPYNLSPDDIYWQMKLFHLPEFTDIPIDPPILRRFFLKVKNGEEDLRKILWHLMVRRTRTDLKNHYKKDLKKEKLQFPERKGPFRIGYSIDKVYPGIYEEIVGYLKSLGYSRYNVGAYVKPRYRKDEDLSKLKQIAPQLVAIMKTLALKRLESSVHAFQTTINTFIGVYEVFLEALDKGIVLAGPESDALIGALLAGDEEAFEEQKEITGEKYPAEKFDVEQLKVDLESDLSILRNILGLVEGFDARNDEKLKKLVETIKINLAEKEKILIFSQYEATTSYLGRETSKHFQKVADVSAATHKRMDLVKRFAPKANEAKVAKEDELRILIATDVLSEGLNLQDADTTINYDLHWNPVRMIQRVGRIDRVGTEHSEIFVYNFFPERDLEAHLGIKERVTKRIQDIHDFLGEDAKLISEEERLNPEGFYLTYLEEKGLEKEEEFEGLGTEEYIHFLKDLKERDPEIFESAVGLSPKVRTAKRGKGGVVVFCKYGNFHQFYRVGGDRKIKELAVDAGLSLMKAGKDEKRRDLPKEFNKLVRRVEERFDEAMRRRDQEMENPENDPVIKFTLKTLSNISRGQSSEVKQKISHLKEILMTGNIPVTTRRKLSELNRKRRKGEKDELLKEFESLLKKTPEVRREKPEKYIEIVASEALVK